jgi:hypothetical protein
MSYRVEAPMDLHIGHVRRVPVNVNFFPSLGRNIQNVSCSENISNWCFYFFIFLFLRRSIGHYKRIAYRCLCTCIRIGPLCKHKYYCTKRTLRCEQQFLFTVNSPPFALSTRVQEWKMQNLRRSGFYDSILRTYCQ